MCIHPTENRVMEAGDTIVILGVKTDIDPPVAIYEIKREGAGWLWEAPDGKEYRVNGVEFPHIELVSQTNKCVIIRNPEGCMAESEERIAKEGDLITILGESQHEVFYRAANGCIHFITKEYVEYYLKDESRKVEEYCDDVPF